MNTPSLQTLASHWVRRKNRQDVRVTKTVVQTVGQITGLLSATCSFSLHGDHKARKCQRDWISPSWNKTAWSKHLSMISAAIQMHWNSSEDPDENWTIFRHRSLFSNGFPRTSISQTQRLVWWEWRRNSGTPWRETPNKANVSDTRSVSSKTAYSNTCKAVQTKTSSWAKRIMKSSPLQTERIWKSSLMHLRQFIVPRAQEPSHPLVQMELVLWLTKKLSWNDGLNTLMVSLIGHHLSMMKLSTDYHRWNIIRCLTCHLARLKDQMQYLQRSTIQEVHQFRETDRLISHYMEKRNHPSRIQGCISYPPIQKERESSSLWQSLGHLFIVNC